MSDKPRTIIAERVDKYCERHKVETYAHPHEVFILITDNKESIFIGERKELVEYSAYEALKDKYYELDGMYEGAQEIEYELETKLAAAKAEVEKLTEAAKINWDKWNYTELEEELAAEKSRSAKLVDALKGMKTWESDWRLNDAQRLAVDEALAEYDEVK